ncbi:MAG: tetratricopeptide repeat protein, partial [Bacteroidota bacterium]
MSFKQSFFFLTALFLFTAVSAQRDERGGVVTNKDTVKQTGNTYAIIIGISDYKAVPDLQFAHKDAQSFEDFLVSDAGGKVPQSNIETFLNENAVRSNVGDAISVIARKAKPGDRVWFFFAGHGDMEDLTQIENGLLLLYNSPNGNYFGMNDDVLEILDLKRYLSPLSQKGVEMIFIVDACHSGNLNGGVQGVQQTASALASSWGKEYKILSCQPNQLSLESTEWGGGRGLFSLQLEEGVKGLADSDYDGKITMFELQSYIQANVAKYSEYKQIPMVTGDLGKSFFKVNPAVLAALKKQKEQNYPLLAKANTKGSEEKYADSLSPAGRQLYLSYKKNLEEQKLIWPKDTNALKDYRLFIKNYPDNPLAAMMRRNLASALNNKFDSIVSPLLRGQTSYSTRDACYYAAMELDSCLSLLGEQHYMFTNLKARKLFMEAMSYTWALSESEFNSSWKQTVEQSIKLLEQSAELEPNAAYTLSALGIHYNYMFEYEKANEAFKKYLELRPNDFYARLSLGGFYFKLKQYDKAEEVYLSLLEKFPDQINTRLELIDVYLSNNKPDKSLAIIDDFIASPELRPTGYLAKGIYFSRTNKTDSAVYYYNEARKVFPGYCATCDNNTGRIYFVNGQLDSARKYYQRVADNDSNYTYGHFNLGTVEELEGNAGAAIRHFFKAVTTATASQEGFVTHLQLHFGKSYQHKDEKTWKEFTGRMHIFNMQYLSYLSALYTYIRVPGFIDSTVYVDF